MEKLMEKPNIFVFKVYDFKGNMYISDPQEFGEDQESSIIETLSNFKEINGFSIEKDGKTRFFNPRYIANIMLEKVGEEVEHTEEVVEQQQPQVDQQKPRKRTYTA